MKKTCIPLLLAFSFITVCPMHTSWAETVYSLGTNDVPVLATPNTQGTVLINLSPGTPVEIKQSNRWVLVQFLDDSGNSRRGWVDAILLGHNPPEAIWIKQLEEDSIGLKTSLQMLKDERNALLQGEKDLSEKVSRLEIDYEQLKTGATEYLQLKEEHDASLLALEDLGAELDALTQENQNLKISQRIKWFAAGGVVFMVGWFIGWLNGRRRKKQKSSYFF